MDEVNIAEQISPPVTSVQRLSAAYATMLQAIRITPKNTVDLLKDQCHISWATAKNVINILQGLDKDGRKTDATPLIYNDATGYHVRPEAGYLVGISIGTKKIRASLIDYAFHPLTLKERQELNLPPIWIEEHPSDDTAPDELTLETPDSLSEIRKICNDIIRPLLELHREHRKHKPFSLLGIGMALPGPIEYQTAKVINALSNIEFQKATLSNIIGSALLHDAIQEGIFFSLDHNAKASVVSEYEYILSSCAPEHRPHNIAVIYIGTGIGAGMIVQSRLLRGARSFSGELGHVRVPNISNHVSCRCGRRDCLEAVVDDEIVRKTQGNLEAKKYSDVINEDEKIEKAKQEASFEVLMEYIPIMINLLTNIISFDIIILSGHDIRKTSGIVDALYDSKSEFMQPHIGEEFKLKAGRNSSSTAAIGSAIQAYYSMCASDLSFIQDASSEQLESLFVNSAFDMHWVE